MKVLQSQTGEERCLVVLSPSAAVSPWVAVAADKLVVAGQSTTVAMTVVSFNSVRPVQEAKRGAVGAAALLVTCAVASSSASAAEVRTRASTVYRVDISIVLRCLVLLVVDLEDGLLAPLVPGTGTQFLNHGQDVPPTVVGHPHFHGLPPTVAVGQLV